MNRSLLRLAAVLIVLTSALLTAQVPENALVIGTHHSALTAATGKSGLFYVTLPTSGQPGGAITTLTGLPPELTVGPSQTGGTASLVRRNSDGTLFVGDVAASGGTCHVHILKMNGARVQSARKVPIGQVWSLPGRTRSVGGLALLPDGRVLVAASDFASGPMAGWSVAILDDKPTVPTLTPIVPNAAMTEPVMHDIAVSPDGNTAYALNLDHATNGFYPSLLYSIDLTKTNYPVTLLKRWEALLVLRLAVNRDGTIYAAGGQFPNAANPSIFQIRNNAIVSTITGSTQTALTGLALDRATGRFAFVSGAINNSVADYSVLTSDRSGDLTVLARPPAGGWGFPFAVAINDAFEPYGHTPNEQRYWFDEFPNPGGLPEIGNANFSVTMRSSGNPSQSFLLIGLGPTNVQVAGATLLVLPAVVLRTPTNAPWAVPIPNDPALRGERIYLQGAHYEAKKWGASRGLELVIQ